jgi:hypothetical protein
VGQTHFFLPEKYCPLKSNGRRKNPAPSQTVRLRLPLLAADIAPTVMPTGAETSVYRYVPAFLSKRMSPLRSFAAPVDMTDTLEDFSSMLKIFSSIKKTSSAPFYSIFFRNLAVLNFPVCRSADFHTKAAFPTIHSSGTRPQ